MRKIGNNMIQVEEIKLSRVKTNKENPRTITKDKFDKLVNSILVFPKMLQLRPIVVDGKMTALGGNMRNEALKVIAKMQPDEIAEHLAGIADFVKKTKGERDALVEHWGKWLENPTAYIVKAGDLSEQEREQFIVKDNVSFGTWNYDALSSRWDSSLLSDWGMDVWQTAPAEFQPDANATGYVPGTPDESEVDNGNISEPIQLEEDDFSNEDVEKAEPRVKQGEIWQLGEHRLMCGDSTDADSVALLMDGQKADMVFTDPPYGMSAVSKSGVLQKRYKTDIMNDDANEVAINSFKLCQKMFSNAKQVWWGANYYTECLPSSECWIVWDKNNGASDQTDCELAWANFRSVVRQFTMASEKKGRVHLTQKPIKLITDIIDKFEKDKRFDVIVDLFGGSGTTLIACEQLHRRCYMMELDPHYCDVIIARWEKLTGKKACKVA